MAVRYHTAAVHRGAGRREHNEANPLGRGEKQHLHGEEAVAPSLSVAWRRTASTRPQRSTAAEGAATPDVYLSTAADIYSRRLPA